jgi:hypothetical protein
LVTEGTFETERTVKETSMKLFRMKSLSMFGLGFLAGSRAGRGPWEKTQETVGQLKDKVSTGQGGIPMSSNGASESPKGNQPTAQLTEM